MTINNVESSQPTILGLDPGRDKCGLALTNREGELIENYVVNSSKLISTIMELIQPYNVNLIIIGDGTTSREWRSQIKSSLVESIQIVTVDEKNSTVEARDRYWIMYPPQGLRRFIPKGLRVPPRPVDDIVAIILIERYLANCDRC